MKKKGQSASMQNIFSSMRSSQKNSLPALEAQPPVKIERIPMSLVFDRRIPPSEYKNLISIDDNQISNFEYARKLFGDPIQASVELNPNSQYKPPIRLAQLQSHTNKDKPAKDPQDPMNQQQTTEQQQKEVKSKEQATAMNTSQMQLDKEATVQASNILQNNPSNNNKSRFGNRTTKASENLKSQSQQQQPINKEENGFQNEENRASGLIRETREKVKRLTTYAERLKKRVISNDFGFNMKRNQKTIKKTQLVKNFIFNEDDFSKMQTQEEEDEIKANATQKENPSKGFVKRTKDEKGKDETKKNLKLDSPSTQKFNSNLTNRADMIDQGEDESDLSDQDIPSSRRNELDPANPLAQKNSTKHNFNKKMKLKKRVINNEEIFEEAQAAYKKVLTKIAGFEKDWNSIGIVPEKTNMVRAQSLKYARTGKILKQIGDKYGELDLKDSQANQKPTINNQKDLLYHFQALLTKPDASGNFKLHKQVQVHQERIRNMRQKDVGIINISNIIINT